MEKCFTVDIIWKLPNAQVNEIIIVQNFDWLNWTLIKNFKEIDLK